MTRWMIGALAALLLAGPARAQQVELPTGVHSFGGAGIAAAVSPQPSGQPLKLFSVTVSAASAGYLMVFEAVSAPASGAVAFPLLRWCAPIAADVPYGFSWGQFPDLFGTSAVVAFSSTGCGTYTPATALWIGGQAQ